MHVELTCHILSFQTEWWLVSHRWSMKVLHYYNVCFSCLTFKEIYIYLSVKGKEDQSVRKGVKLWDLFNFSSMHKSWQPWENVQLYCKNNEFITLFCFWKKLSQKLKNLLACPNMFIPKYLQLQCPPLTWTKSIFVHFTASSFVLHFLSLVAWTYCMF